MNRYSEITEKNPREIVLLRSHPCRWGRCFFCDYIADNMTDESEMIAENKEILSEVQGKYESLEVINSASVFELPKETWQDIYDTCLKHNIKKLNFEAYYNYRHRLEEVRSFFKGIEVTFKCGIESFDDNFRNEYLRKGIVFSSPEEVAQYFDTICLLVGIKGQTKEMVDRDMDIVQRYFKRGCINIFVENTTPVKRDDEIIRYFKETYGYMDEDDRFEILWNNTDFGVGD